jgi:hypothetical protein
MSVQNAVRAHAPNAVNVEKEANAVNVVHEVIGNFRFNDF